MKIPLIFNANPLGLSKRTPAKIPLDAGRWRIISENLIDSILGIRYGPPSGFHSSYVLDGILEFRMEKPGVAYVEVRTPGSERSISVYLERI